MIHPTAIIDPEAVVDPTVEIGPYAIIDAHVRLGSYCRVGPHAHLTGHTIIGARNVFHTGCVIGDAPQDLKYRNEPTRLRIGDDNIFREFATVHRSNKVAEETVLGSHNLLMVNSHVGHNARLGDYVILANGALLGGHVTVDDRAFISGNCLVHQFTRVGTLALMQGGSAISMDLPPFTVARGDNGICGLNTVGLRRAGFTTDERQELKRLYHQLFRGGVNLREALRVALPLCTGRAGAQLLEFIGQSKRGVCPDTSRNAHDRDRATMI
jgi:UDP-N-acetylglucosamine acyltransferase